MENKEGYLEFISSESYKNQIDVWYRAYNISREKTELFYDFLMSLYNLLQETYLGSEVFELEIPQQALTVAEMKLLLLARYPALEGKTFRMAVNERFVGDDFEVLSGVKIALMPPFSGG